MLCFQEGDYIAKITLFYYDMPVKVCFKTIKRSFCLHLNPLFLHLYPLIRQTKDIMITNKNLNVFPKNIEIFLQNKSKTTFSSKSPHQNTTPPLKLSHFLFFDFFYLLIL